MDVFSADFDFKGVLIHPMVENITLNQASDDISRTLNQASDDISRVELKVSGLLGKMTDEHKKEIDTIKAILKIKDSNENSNNG